MMPWQHIDRYIRQRLAHIRLPFLGRVTGAGAQPQVAGFDGEIYPDVRIIGQVGSNSGLPKDSQVVMLPLLGSSAHAVIIGSQGGMLTVAVEEGEYCIYDQFGHKIHLKQSGIEIVGNVRVTGNFHATGLVSDGINSMQTMRTIFDTHAGHQTGDGLPVIKMSEVIENNGNP